MRVHVVAPEGFDDPARPSGGNIYDRRVCAGLSDLGWDVRVTPVGGETTLARALTAVPDGEVVLIDGLIASPSAAVLLRHTRRVRLTVLLHMPLATALDGPYDARTLRSEQAVLEAATTVIVTSDWTRREILKRYAIPPARVYVAHPGADPAAVARPSGIGHFLCVGALAWHKGQDLLVEALAGLTGEWACTLAGPLDHAPAFVEELRARITRLALDDRIRLTGPLTGPALDRAYAAAGLLIAPSRADTYGMVVTEALARAIPVLTAGVGGLPEALGHTAAGIRPGWLIPPGTPHALTEALTQWLRDEPHRRDLRAAARQRRSTLPTWNQTVQRVSASLSVPDRLLLDGKPYARGHLGPPSGSSSADP